MKCAYDDKTMTCRRCGHVAKRLPTFRTCPAVPDRPRARIPRVAVGDLVETMLTSVGITKERVQQWTRTQDCGCKARQRWLNQWGYQQQNRMERLLNKAARWYGIT